MQRLAVDGGEEHPGVFGDGRLKPGTHQQSRKRGAGVRRLT
jgi:hypothetical protein